MNGTDQTLSEIRQSLLEPNQTATFTLPQERSESNRVKAQSPVIKLYVSSEINLAHLRAQDSISPLSNQKAWC